MYAWLKGGIYEQTQCKFGDLNTLVPKSQCTEHLLFLSHFASAQITNSWIPYLTVVIPMWIGMTCWSIAIVNAHPSFPWFWSLPTCDVWATHKIVDVHGPNFLHHLYRSYDGWWLWTFCNFLCFHILGTLIPFDEYFSEGLKPPTSYDGSSNNRDPQS